MKNHFLLYFLAIFTLLSCNNNQDEIEIMNSYLQVNYQFNSKILNQQKGDYYLRAELQPERKTESLNALDSKYELFILSANRAISNKENNIEKLVLEYYDILNDITKIVNQRDDYLLPKIDSVNKTKTTFNEFRLNAMKNRLVIAMSYTFEYVMGPTLTSDHFYKPGYVNTNISHIKNNGIKLTLSSDLIQKIPQNRQIIIDEIQFNGKDKKINYELNDNYSFSDIVMDSLKKGKYHLKGVIRLYERTGKIDVPFNKKFEVE